MKTLISISVENENANSLVQVRNNQVVTTSLQVAKVFQKEHKDVLRAINSLDCSGIFRKRNFALSEYTRKNSNVSRAYPMYYLTRDGFTFLAMGFTGKIAARFKEEYIDAFNEMEKSLSEGINEGYILYELKKKFDESKKKIRAAIREYATETGSGIVPCDLAQGFSINLNLSIVENFSTLLPLIHNSTVAGWYALFQQLQLTKENKRIKKIMQNISSILLTEC